MSKAERMLGTNPRAPSKQQKLKRMKAIEMMPNATLDDLSSLLGIPVRDVRDLCSELGDARCLS